MRPHHLVAALALLAPIAQAAPVPTVIVDIHARGHGAVDALKRDSGVAWSAEFGNELLLGIDPGALPAWLARSGVRPGPEALAFDEVVVRDHVCTHQDHEPGIAIVGGFEIVRLSPLRALSTRGPAIAGEPLPEDGVVAREARNAEQPMRAAAADPILEALVARVDGDRWYDTVSTLASMNRNSFSPVLPSAHDWVQARFGDAGLATSTFPFSLTSSSCAPLAPPTITINDPIGRKTGAITPDEWVVVGAHYDSRNSVRCDGTANPQPGANDNGTGCAAVIELARVFAPITTARTMVFMCFAGEEQGLVGSRRYVESLQASGDIAKVKHMINLDMLGHAIDDTLSARAETTAANQALLATYATAAATYAPEINLITVATTQAYSDHWYFIAAGVPGMFTWENGAGIYPHYHQATDVPANMSRARELATGVMKMDAAILAAVAGIDTIFVDGYDD